MKHIFLAAFWILLTTVACQRTSSEKIITVTGEMEADDMGLTLPHEHVLVDFIGADSVEPPRYNRDAAFGIILPHIQELKNYGVKTFVECTPKFLGRDVLLLKKLSTETGIRFLTNTGFYGAQNNKFIPAQVQTMAAEEIARFWIAEFEQGIDGTGIRPGFIKIAIERRALSDFHARLAKAAALAHKATGLTIMSHTGPAVGAFQQLEILKAEGVAPDAFIWTHAHNETDLSKQVEAARAGAWVALDAFWGKEGQAENLVRMVVNLKQNNCLHRVLLSHDAGWYDPEKPDGAGYQPHTLLFGQLLPALKKAGISDADLHQVLVNNPAKAFAVKKRLLEK